MKGLTNATSQDAAWCSKHQTTKSVLSVRQTLPDKRGRFTENLSIYLATPAPNSLLQNPSNFGATASHWLLYFLLFFFFLIFNRMDAWSLMRGDAFKHFVCGSRWVNIRLGVLLLIPKSPHCQRLRWSQLLKCVFSDSRSKRGRDFSRSWIYIQKLSLMIDVLCVLIGRRQWP